jgi:uncharacterized protein
MKFIGWIASILLIIGGLNWGLVGIANLNLIDNLLGGTGIARLIYVLVGLAAIWEIYGRCCCCGSSCSTDK